MGLVAMSEASGIPYDVLAVTTVETGDPQRAERLAGGSPEDEPGAGRRRLAAQVEQEPGRPWAQERRAAQVEHQCGFPAEQRDEVGLEHPVAGLEVADERRDDGAPGGATAPGPAGGQGAEGGQRLRHMGPSLRWRPPRATLAASAGGAGGHEGPESLCSRPAGALWASRAVPPRLRERYQPAVGGDGTGARAGSGPRYCSARGHDDRCDQVVEQGGDASSEPSPWPDNFPSCLSG
jgi:hypothetical protein